MKRKYSSLLLGALFQLFLVHVAHGQQADDIVGTWWTTDQEAKVEIAKENSGYFGVVTWLEAEESAGAKVLDNQNKNTALRTRPIVGIRIVEKLTYEDGEWKGGELYDPESGESYRCLVKLSNDGERLEVRGYLGMPAFGRSVYWEKVAE